MAKVQYEIKYNQSNIVGKVINDAIDSREFFKIENVKPINIQNYGYKYLKE